MYKAGLIFLLILLAGNLFAQTPTQYYITANRVFDGVQMHEGWAVVVNNDRIVEAGPKDKVSAPAGSIKVYYPNSTLLPGLIEGHSHLFLYPYNLTDWNTQVLLESDAFRTARATMHAKATLMAGFTSTRDLGTEGAGYADVGLKRAIDEGIIPGPRMIVATRAIVATGSYAPKGYDTDMTIMIGAEAADGQELVRVVRDQIGKGADVIKVYADYHWSKGEESRPTFSLDELKLIVETAASAGRPTVAHAETKEGMRRAILAGVETIEHGDFMDEETARLMKEHNVVYFPTLAAVEKVREYKGWKKGLTPEPEEVIRKKKSFAAAMRSGVIIGMGGDVGVFTHGENALEMELMVEYGMSTLQVLRAVTSINAKAFHLEKLAGSIGEGLKADLVIVSGNPLLAISDLRKVIWVMKDGVVYKQ